MNKLIDGPADGKSLKRFHNDHIQRAGERGIPKESILDFQEWMSFLLGQKFAIKDSPGPYSITQLGKAFLAHVREVGSSDATPL